MEANVEVKHAEEEQAEEEEEAGVMDDTSASVEEEPTDPSIATNDEKASNRSWVIVEHMQLSSNMLTKLRRVADSLHVSIGCVVEPTLRRIADSLHASIRRVVETIRSMTPASTCSPSAEDIVSRDLQAAQEAAVADLEETVAFLGKVNVKDARPTSSNLYQVWVIPSAVAVVGFALMR